MLDFIKARQAEERENWTELQTLADPTALQKATEQGWRKNKAATDTCQDLAGKIWECLENNELEYVKTLQDHSAQLDSLLKLMTSQSASFVDASASQTQLAESALQKVRCFPSTEKY